MFSAGLGFECTTILELTTWHECDKTQHKTNFQTINYCFNVKTSLFKLTALYRRNKIIEIYDQSIALLFVKRAEVLLCSLQNPLQG
jgi:hypothetical protein